MSEYPTNTEIADNQTLWDKYMDTSREGSKYPNLHFNNFTYQERLDMIDATFPDNEGEK